ncbi:O-antigen ligase-related protein [Candidatus Omnitrophus magneticus]|uniref:O-antigen ligase-related protein n=1 Tax=Candidatus Omnitrophus magneticus TaxID=1609969 RepID=A0A0F0CQ95_9BACT|nr:O-antigen ligase-related protein [Candidatus Omnitrophus magneticus]
MILVWFVKQFITRDLKWIKNTPIVILFVFLFWNILSCVNSGYAKESFRGIFKVIEYGLVFIIVSTSFYLAHSARVRKFFYVITAMAIPITINGFVQYFTGTGFLRHRELISLDSLRRISSSFVHPNDYGVYLVIVSIILIAAGISLGITLKKRALIFFVLGLSLVSLLLTGSRGAWISFVCAFLILGVLKSKKILVFFIISLIFIFFFLPNTAKDRLSGLTNFKSGSTWERIMLWEGAINMIKEHPVLGFGVNTYSRNFPLYKPKEYIDVRYSHNCYLHMASEIGITGAVIFLIFLVATLILSFKYIPFINDHFSKAVVQGLYAGLSGFLINSAFDTHLYSVTLAVFFYISFGYLFLIGFYAAKKNK